MRKATVLRVLGRQIAAEKSGNGPKISAKKPQKNTGFL